MVHKYEVKIRKLKKQIAELEMNDDRYNSNTRDLASSHSLSIPIFDR